MRCRQLGILGTAALISVPVCAADFYGQVNKAILWADDGRETRVIVGDNDRSSTRFGFRGEQVLGGGLKATFLLEGELKDDDSSIRFGGGAKDAPSASPATFAERHARVGLAGDFGAVFLGRTSSATDGLTELDLAPANDVMGSEIEKIGGALQLGGGQTFGDHYSNFEGLDLAGGRDRAHVVRYDSPTFNGVQLTTAVANGGDVDVAARYGATLGDFEVKAGLGFGQNNSAGGTGLLAGTQQWSGAVTAKHSAGLAATVAYGRADTDSSLSPEFWYAKVGYGQGPWGVAVDYGTAEEISALGAEAEAFGLGGQYDFGKGVSMGVLYRVLRLDVPSIDTDEGRVVMLATKIKF